VPAYLIRHAHAGHRADWDGPDGDRPLSTRGRHEADHVAALLGDEPIGMVLSSPAVRCVQSVEPLAAARGVDVEVEKRIGEGRDPVKAIDLMIKRIDRNPAVCSHGDLIPEMIGLLRRRGMKLVENGPTKKGSFWTLEYDDQAFTKATYHPPGG
jgi:8-oxo-dGTP diphosphatase